jgi:hypothetical protein
MTPFGFLGILVAVSTAAVYADAVVRRRRGRIVRKLAADWRMNYTPADSLQVTPKIARHFPIPGAANLQVRDLIYGIEQDRYRYVFTAEYTAGVVRTKTRRLRVGTFSEPRNRSLRHAADAVSPVELAPEEGTIEEQYLSLAPASATRVPREERKRREGEEKGNRRGAGTAAPAEEEKDEGVRS